MVFAGLAFLMANFTSAAKADEWNKATKVTFADSVQVPGKVLPAGTYYFKLLNNPGDRHIVQIFNEDRSSLVTTIFAVPSTRIEPAGKTVITFAERPADQPEALEAWFYPGDTVGQEFVYPAAEAELLSRLNHREVPSTGSEEAYPTDNSSASTGAPAASTSSEPVTAQHSAAQTQESAPATSSTPAPSSSQPETMLQKTQLPQTASSLPVIGLVGFFLFGVAVALRFALRS